MQPSEFRGQLPDARYEGYSWAADETQAWPQKQMARPTHMVSQRQPVDWRDTRLVRLALAAFCLASIVASASIVIVSIRVVWAIWPK